MTDNSIAFKAARGVGWVFAWRMVTRLLGLASTLVLVRVLQPADFGLVALAAAFAGSIDTLSSIGTEYALIRERTPDRALYDTAFTLNLLRGLITMVLIAATAWPAAAMLNEPRLIPLLLVLAVAMFFSALENIGVVDFRRDFSFGKEFQLFLLPRVLGVISNIILILLWPSYWVLIISTVLTRAGRTAMSYLIHPYRPRLSLRAWRPLFSYSVWLWAEGLVHMLRERADPILIGWLLDPARVGVISVGGEIASLPSTEIAQPISRVLFPGFAAALHAGSSMGDVYCRAIGVIATVILPICLGISLLADPIVRLMLGPNWLTAIIVIQITSCAGAAAVIGYAAGNILGVTGQTRQHFLLTAFSASVRIPLLAFLTWRDDVRGAALAVALAAMIDTAMMSIVVARYLHLGVLAHVQVLWRPIIATLLMIFGLNLSGLGWFATSTAQASQIQTIIVTSALGAILYTATLMLAWLAAGRPAGAERFLLDLGLHAMQKLPAMRRVRR